MLHGELPKNYAANPTVTARLFPICSQWWKSSICRLLTSICYIFYGQASNILYITLVYCKIVSCCLGEMKCRQHRTDKKEECQGGSFRSSQLHFVAVNCRLLLSLCSSYILSSALPSKEGGRRGLISLIYYDFKSYRLIRGGGPGFC